MTQLPLVGCRGPSSWYYLYQEIEASNGVPLQRSVTRRLMSECLLMFSSSRARIFPLSWAAPRPSPPPSLSSVSFCLSLHKELVHVFCLPNILATPFLHISELAARVRWPGPIHSLGFTARMSNYVRRASGKRGKAKRPPGGPSGYTPQ